MTRGLSFLLILILPALLHAATQPTFHSLNKITFQLTAEQWITTKTAKITVGVDATLNENQLAKARTDISNKLTKLAPSTEWHMTTFERSQDSSGLEKLHITAEARLAESALSDLRSQAKAMSKPGETYTVLNVEYLPTIAEIEATEMLLRHKIYETAKNELATINKIYPEQKYYLHHIDFGGVTPLPQPIVTGMSLAKIAPTLPLTVSNNVILTANVVLAANMAPLQLPTS